MSLEETSTNGPNAPGIPKVIYLDQNKWIDLLKAAVAPDQYPHHYSILELLVEQVDKNKIVVPLTQTNIYETYKINDPERRNGLAYVQASLSTGHVFRGRYKRLEKEIVEVMRRAYNLEPESSSSLWFLSTVFFEATAEREDDRLGGTVSDLMYTAIKKNPKHHLFDFLTTATDEIRREATRNFSEGSEKLRQEIEIRRQRYKGQSLSMRRKIYGAILIRNEIELILGFARKAHLPTQDETSLMRTCARKIANEAPTYFIERELSLKIEAQNRPIEENDFRDMQTFCTVMKYADIVIAENQFSNLSKQANLDQIYNTQISTDLSQLRTLLEQ